MDTQNVNRPHATIKVVFMAVLALAALIWAAAQLKAYRFIGSNPNATRSISVSGEGKTYIKADVATVNVSVTSEAGPDNLSEIQDRNSKSVNSIIGYVKSQGVKEEDIKTVNYSIYPRYNYSQSGQQFLGYTVRQDVQIKMRDLSKVGTILNGAVQNGANEVSGLTFTVDDPLKPSEEARADAIKDAKTKAEKLAKDLGVKLVRLSNYSESAGGQPVPLYYDVGGYGKGGGQAPEIQVGQNEVRSMVTLTYEIE